MPITGYEHVPTLVGLNAIRGWIKEATPVDETHAAELAEDLAMVDLEISRRVQLTNCRQLV